jgi:hypothetical protein
MKMVSTYLVARQETPDSSNPWWVMRVDYLLDGFYTTKHSLTIGPFKTEEEAIAAKRSAEGLP